MSVSTTETIGFCSQFTQFLQDNQAALQPQGLDVTDWITELTTLKNTAVAKDAEQDDLRVALKAKTTETQEAVKLTYQRCSTRLDAVIGVLGKTTPIAKQASRLRSSLIKQAKRKTVVKAQSSLS